MHQIVSSKTIKVFTVFLVNAIGCKTDFVTLFHEVERPPSRQLNTLLYCLGQPYRLPQSCCNLFNLPKRWSGALDVKKSQSTAFALFIAEFASCQLIGNEQWQWARPTKLWFLYTLLPGPTPGNVVRGFSKRIGEGAGAPSLGYSDKMQATYWFLVKNDRLRLKEAHSTHVVIHTSLQLQTAQLQFENIKW